MNAIEELKERLGGKVSTAESVLESHGRGESYRETHPPLAVVFPESTEDVQAVMAWATEHAVPVIAVGAGTSLEGQTVPQGPAVSLDLSKMTRILEVRPEDFLAVVEPGVTYQTLNKALRTQGLFFPVDPGADASLGGMAATNASGTTTVRYGGMHQNVLALEVVLAGGEVIQVGRAVRKTSSGYDLKDLFIGSEGTLGIITKLSVKLHPLPVHMHTLRAFFATVDAAAQAAYLLMASGLPLARVELVDDRGMKDINWYLGRTYPELPALFLEFHSATRRGLEEESAEVQRLVREAGASSVEPAVTAEERTAQWEARHQLYWAFTKHHPGRLYMLTDAAVPLSRMPEIVALAHHLLSEMELDGTVVGHVGDGNFHTVIAATPAAYARTQAFADRIAEAALAMGGTATGEHGIGVRKKKYLALEHPSSTPWMRQIKRLFDPKGLLNPGKVV
ncbi:MAG TPA: FAD-binding oxidoreductase [bacterium]|jgi:D-lactate dehydrogenase (cytochrome)